MMASGMLRFEIGRSVTQTREPQPMMSASALQRHFRAVVLSFAGLHSQARGINLSIRQGPPSPEAER